MACYQTRTTVSLRNGEVVALPDVRGATLRVTSGALWLTEERQRSDVMLRAGDNYLVEFDGKTVVEGRDGARFTIVGKGGRDLRLPRCDAPMRRFAATLASFFSPPRQVPYV
jgi:hypothetical protein